MLSMDIVPAGLFYKYSEKPAMENYKSETNNL